jgi:hypothetical protein
MSKRAYIIRDDYDHTAVVVFAESAKRAYEGNSGELLNCSDEEDIENCERAPDFDKYAELGYVPPHVLIEVGWWLECIECNTKVSDDFETDEGDALEPIYKGDNVFCSAECHYSFYEARRMDKENKERVTQAALEKWPGITVVDANGYHKDIMVEFSFPGSLGTATWRLNAESVMVQQRDHEKWKEFVATLKGSTNVE